MERIGILLGIVVAICWGSADTVATFASRRSGTFVTTMTSLLVSVVVLTLFGLFAFASLSLTSQTIIMSAPIGLLTGVMAAIGYFSLYRGLELGPLAIVSPVVAADGAIAAILAIVLLHEPINAWQISLLACILCGIFFASTDLAELRTVLRTSGSAALVKAGPRWGLLAMIAFGIMLFGIGLSAQSSGWFLPIFWTRCFAALALAGVGTGQRMRRSQRSQQMRQSVASRTDTDSFNEATLTHPIVRAGISLAVIVGLFETTGLLVYSIDTQIAATGIAAAISSSFGLIPLLAGITIFRERPKLNQVAGVLLVITGLMLLAIKPV